MPPTFKKCSCSYFQNYNLRNWLNCSSGYLPRAPVWGRWICRIFGAIHHREERQKSGSTGKSEFKGTFINDVMLICVTSFMNDSVVEHRQNMFFTIFFVAGILAFPPLDWGLTRWEWLPLTHMMGLWPWPHLNWTELNSFCQLCLIGVSYFLIIK